MIYPETRGCSSTTFIEGALFCSAIRNPVEGARVNRQHSQEMHTNLIPAACLPRTCDTETELKRWSRLWRSLLKRVGRQRDFPRSSLKSPERYARPVALQISGQHVRMISLQAASWSDTEAVSSLHWRLVLDLSLHLGHVISADGGIIATTVWQLSLSFSHSTPLDERNFACG